jgi:predicted ATPase/DNA-binding SARP family transcriptional activator
MEVLLLGPLEVRDQGRTLNVPGNRPRALLALLALNAGRVMRAERLIELLWGGEAPPTAANALQVHVSALRKVLEPEGPPYRLLISDRSGYMLKVGSEQTDFARFEQLVSRGHRALKDGEVLQAAELIGQAIAQWRGSALADLADQPWSVGEARRLEDLRLAAEEDRIEAELSLGRHAELIPHLHALVATHPLRERLSGQLMLALYRSGRQAEASDVYQRARGALVDGLGMEPGFELQHLLKAILNQDPSLGMPSQKRARLRLDNLPSPLTSFVGREPEIAEIKSLLSATRLLTLTGPGGIGKTRLATEVARNLLGDYEDGVWLASLAALADPDLVPQAVASALALRGPSEQSASEALIQYLRERRCLLVLDSCEHLIEACAHLAETLVLSCPHVTALATSREALGVTGEIAWPVPPLAPEQGALELFRQRALTTIRSFALEGRNLAIATEICRRVDGIPLAIELAAGKLKVISLEELSLRLEDRFAILTGGNRTAMPRHKTMRAAIDWSYELLSERERMLLRMLSVFAGSFALQAAETVCAGDVLDLLSSLFRKSLVQVDRGEFEVRYRLLDTIREYGQARLSEAPEESSVALRHFEFYLDLAERAAPQLHGSSGTMWMRRLMDDHDNIRAALRWSLAARQYDKLASLVLALGWFWYLRCFFNEGRGWFDAALKAFESAPAATRAGLLLGAGELAWAQGDHGPDRAMFEEALSLAHQIGDEGLVGEALLRLGLAEHGQSNPTAATKHLKASVEKLRKHGPPFLLAEALNNLGYIQGVMLNQPDEARPLIEESLSIARECGDQWLLHMVLDSIANIAQTQGRIDAAQEFQEESLRTASALNDAWALPYTLEGFVKLACERAFYERAVRIAGAAARLRHDTGAVQLPGEKAQIYLLVQSARSHLLAPDGDAAWQSGWQMSEREAVGYALSHQEPGRNPG